MLIPADGVHWRHGGVYQSVVGEHAHRHSGVKDFLDLGFALSLLLQGSIAVGLAHRAIHDAVNIFGSQVLRERSIALLAFLTEETLLQILHVFAHCLFCILLHARINGCVYAQSVLIEVVWRTIGFVIFVPYAKDINIEGLSVDTETLEDLLSVDNNAWKEDIANIKEFYAQVGERVPQAMYDELAALEARLKA